MLTSGVRAVSGTSPVTTVCIVPPGPGQLVLTGGGTAVLVGFGTALTATNGLPFPSGGFLQLDLFPAGGGGTLCAISTSGTVSVGFMVSAASAQTGL